MIAAFVRRDRDREQIGMRRWATGALAALIVGHATQLQAADFKLEKQDGKTRLLLTGKIMPGDAGKFAAVVKSAKSKGDTVTVVVLSSPGGSGPDSVKIAKAVREAKMTTSVPADAVCASGCFIIFAGGTDRTAEPTARIGVHAAGQGGRETDASRRHTREIAHVLKSFGVPTHITDKLIMTPHKDITAISADELRSGMNVTIGGVTAATASTEIAVALARFPPSFREATTALERGDPAAAIRVMRPLAEGGDRFAQVMMGIAHERLKPPDNAGVTKWYRLAADQGDSAAQYYLGRFYENGQRGLPTDRIEAFKWLTLAAQRGSNRATGELSKLEKQMTADELAEGKKRATEWRSIGAAGFSPSPSQSSAGTKSSPPSGYKASQSLINTYGSTQGAPASTSSSPTQSAPPLALPTATGEFATLIEARVIAARHNPSASMKAWNFCLTQIAVAVARDSNAAPEAIAEVSYGQCKSEEARAYQEVIDASPTNSNEAAARWKDDVDKQLWPVVKLLQTEKMVAAIRADRGKMRVITGKSEGASTFAPSQSAPQDERKTMEAGIP
jgi:TPR repeat protein